jgi:uncharacterized membrane protein (DUF485 family)
MPYNLLMPEEERRSLRTTWLLVWQRRWWIALATLFILVWWLVPPLLYRHTGADASARLKAITDTRTALLAGLIGVGALLTFWLNSRVYRITAQGHITERYTKAIDQLDDKKAQAVRLGGLYALERIARDSLDDRVTIAEVLCAYVRTAPRRSAPHPEDTNPPVADAASAGAPAAKLPPLTVRAPDVQAALTILGRWQKRLGERPFLHLHDADLQRAYIDDAQLEGVELDDAQLQGAVLRGAQLKRAVLRNAQLQGADLRDAQLEDAELDGAQLQGADLRQARGLTQAQLEAARGNAETQLPAGLERPASWPDTAPPPASPGPPR